MGVGYCFELRLEGEHIIIMRPRASVVWRRARKAKLSVFILKLQAPSDNSSE